MNCECELCGLDFDFDLPVAIIKAAEREEVVVFAGAGISTEVDSVMPDTFYTVIKSQLESMPEGESFPEIMSAFEVEQGRRELVKRLKSRFDYINSFSDLNYAATRFHRALATMPYVKDIVTTNWDTYFEEECSATPFVHGEDFAFSDLPDRKVYKIHGSITSLASLVATQDDYAQRLEDFRSNALGGRLRDLLATKTVIFIGYSLRDWNFRELYEALLTDMGAFRPRAFVVSPFPNEAAEELGLEVIKTSGYKFLQALKSSLTEKGYLPDSIYSTVAAWLDEVIDAHNEIAEFSHREYPALAYSLSYQDGLIHGFKRMLSRRSSGEYSDQHHVYHMARSYGGLVKSNMESGRWFDAAYADGYGNAVVALLIAGDPDMDSHSETDELDSSTAPTESTVEVLNAATDKDQNAVTSSNGGGKTELQPPPFWMIFGEDGPEYVDDTDKLVEALGRAQSVNEKAYEEAVRLTSDVEESLIINHRPFLHGVHGN